MAPCKLGHDRRRASLPARRKSRASTASSRRPRASVVPAASGVESGARATSLYGAYRRSWRKNSRIASRASRAAMNSRSEVVPDLRRAADERLFLVEAPPLAGHEPEPDVVRDTTRASARAAVSSPGSNRGTPLLRSPRGGVAAESRASRASSTPFERIEPDLASASSLRARRPRRDASPGRRPTRSQVGHPRKSRGSRAVHRTARTRAHPRPGRRRPASRGPQPWSVDRSVSKPSTSEPQPSRAAA